MGGTLYKEIIETRGGEQASKYDLFIDVSADGFDVFLKSSYDCWPLISMIHNLDPSERFLMRNVLPLGFLKEP